jgi:hypothetical protein
VTTKEKAAAMKQALFPPIPKADLSDPNRYRYLIAVPSSTTISQQEYNSRQNSHTI